MGTVEHGRGHADDDESDAAVIPSSFGSSSHLLLVNSLKKKKKKMNYCEVHGSEYSVAQISTQKCARALVKQ